MILGGFGTGRIACPTVFLVFEVVGLDLGLDLGCGGVIEFWWAAAGVLLPGGGWGAVGSGDLLEELEGLGETLGLEDGEVVGLETGGCEEPGGLQGDDFEEGSGRGGRRGIMSYEF